MNGKYQITGYKIVGNVYLEYAKSISIFIDYNYTYNCHESITKTFVSFDFDDSVNLYKLNTESTSLDLIEFLILDKTLIDKQKNGYYLNTHILLKLI